MPARHAPLLVAVLAAMIVGCGGHEGPSPTAQLRQVVRGYLDALANDDYRAACRTLVTAADNKPAARALWDQFANSATDDNVFDVLGPCPGALRGFAQGMSLADLRFAKIELRSAGHGSYWVRTDSQVAIAHEMRFAHFHTGWKLVAYQ